MSRSVDVDEFLKEYGRDGIRLLALFNLLRPKVKSALSRQATTWVDENKINNFCMATAKKLLRGKDTVTEKDVEKLLTSLKTTQKA